MTMINSISEGRNSLQIRGKFGTPTGFPVWLGWSKLGDTNFQAGYYQVRKSKKGHIISLSRHYWPTDRPTERQLLIRQIFRQGVVAWHDLTTLEKKKYNKMKYPPAMQGFGRFMRKYLKENIP